MRAKAIRAIEKRGALLVYPLNNRPLPLSLWSELFPRVKMRWEWDQDGDQRVSDLWILREELSRSGKVVYAKWFQNRATFFSRSVFVSALAYLQALKVTETLAGPSRDVLDTLLADSPLSTKQLKAAVGLEGRLLEPQYNRALKPLWKHLAIVGYGEFDDSSFPSLGVGATATLFEDLWTEAANISALDGESQLRASLGEDNPFFLFARKVVRLMPR